MENILTKTLTYFHDLKIFKMTVTSPFQDVLSYLIWVQFLASFPFWGWGASALLTKSLRAGPAQRAPHRLVCANSPPRKGPSEVMPNMTEGLSVPPLPGTLAPR